MIRRPPRSTQSRSTAASDVYKRQHLSHPKPASDENHALPVFVYRPSSSLPRLLHPYFSDPFAAFPAAETFLFRSLVTGFERLSYGVIFPKGHQRGMLILNVVGHTVLPHPSIRLTKQTLQGHVRAWCGRRAFRCRFQAYINGRSVRIHSWCKCARGMDLGCSSALAHYNPRLAAPRATKAARIGLLEVLQEKHQHQHTQRI